MDYHALGRVAAELLVGRIVGANQCEGPAVAVGDLTEADVENELATIVSSLTERGPSARPDSLHAFTQACETLAAD